VGLDNICKVNLILFATYFGNFYNLTLWYHLKFVWKSKSGSREISKTGLKYYVDVSFTIYHFDDI